jgi:UDP-N-acetylmuramoyl-L-alanyl-D-glutamate--2,6-diaminopimelate ligase
VVVRGVRHDSRAVSPGDLFVAITGERIDGSGFVPAAIEQGAVAVACERPLASGVPEIVVADVRAALGLLAHRVYGDPTEHLQVTGITGTNGKTTTSYLLESILTDTGATPALMGTIVFRGPGGSVPAPYTTPEADEIARFARRAVDDGATHLVMEVSSHGLSLHRADAVRFDVAAFTNLTQDHLDYHGTFEAYGDAKAKLFLELAPRVSVVCVDAPFGVELARRIEAQRPGATVIRCSARTHEGQPADIAVRTVASTRGGMWATIATPAGDVVVETPLVGAHNLENIVVALGCAAGLGIDIADAARALGDARGAPGRLERVDDPRDVGVFVDYAHTPDALARALAALRPSTPGRLWVVFGCGGDRDRAKRPMMGAAAAEGADLCVATSDNPRTESPRQILDEVVPGIEGTGVPALTESSLGSAVRGFFVCEDRSRAIHLALAAARAGDTVLIAGKGHEDYQIIGTEKRPFDDRRVAASAIASLTGADA